MLESAAPVKRTKAELLAEFEEIKRKYEELKGQSSPGQLDLKKKESAAVLQKTAVYTPSNLEDEISALRKKVQTSLDELSGSLSEESKKLIEIQGAIVIEAERLKEARQIDLASQALDVLINDYEAKEREFTIKGDAAAEALAQDMARQKKDWEREQEEYAYNLKTERKKEEEAYEVEWTKKETARKEALARREAELQEKEAVLATRQAEIQKMEKDIEEFPVRMEQAVKDAREQTEKTLQKDFAVDKRLAEQEGQAEKNLNEMKIIGLQETIKNYALEIKSLKDALAASSQHAQTLAATVIEGMSGMKQAKATEQGKEQ